MVLALVFLVTSLAFSVVVIWQMISEKNKNNPASQTPTSAQNKLQGAPLEGFTPINKVNKLKVIDIKKGTGQVVKSGDTVTVDYTGAVASTGIVFESSLDTGSPIPISLNVKSQQHAISGWIEGVPGMKVGGKRRLLIPAIKAYGATPPQGSNIPVNADLVFDITLRKIGP